MEEIKIVDNGKLIEEDRWIDYISSLENNFDELETNKERAKRKIKDALVRAVEQDTNANFGIMFSGGVDSSLLALIAQKLGREFTCYSIGLEDAEDILFSQKIAKAYGFKHKYKVYSIDEVEALIKQVVKVIGADVVNVGVASVELAVCHIAKEDGISILLGGLGSEEIFCGYQRHLEALKDGYSIVHMECWRGLKNMWKRDLVRDFKIAKLANVEFKVPFLARDVIVQGMNLHPMFKIDGSNNKLIIREIAEEFGLAREFAWRRKRAAQYGSNIDKAMEKLAKQHGFKDKKEYLQSL